MKAPNNYKNESSRKLTNDIFFELHDYNNY